MSNSMLNARQAISEALEPIMPGRFQPYRPTTIAPPMLWIDHWTIGMRDGGVIVTFTVAGAVDGADHSQQAVLDDMAARSWDALRVVAGPKARAARSTQTPDPNRSGEFRRGFELDVDVPIRSTTFCTPDVAPVTIPPLEYAEVS